MPKRFRIENVHVAVGSGDEELASACVEAIKAREPEAIRADLLAVEVLRRAIDARKKTPRFALHVAATLADAAAARLDAALAIPRRKKGALSEVTIAAWEDEPAPPETAKPRARPDLPVVIIGAGPGGLFAAQRLLDGGVPSVILERGQPVRRRVLDVAALWREGRLDRESNPLFGEGGAGTFSDGKLYTRTRDPRIRAVWRSLVDFGAASDILVDAHPHVGTNRLRAVIPHLREDLQRRGVEVRFGARVDAFEVANGRIEGVVLHNGETIRTHHVILAVGHSARDTYRAALDAGVELEPMPFALGVRIEHSQEFIDKLQLGEAAGDRHLGAASYRLARNFEDGRGAYSFCMCPGGQVVASMHEPGTVVTNGMSASSRGGKLANAGLVVSIKPSDYAAKKGEPAAPLDGVAFQKRYEEAAYAVGGGGFFAPAQRASDFLAGRPTENPIESTYLPGVRPADVSKCLPRFVSSALKRALTAFNRTMPGFAGDDAVLIGVESRVSAPVRMPRTDTGESTTVRGLWPVGEGAGWAGGITSAAVDGMHAAESILSALAGVAATSDHSSESR